MELPLFFTFDFDLSVAGVYTVRMKVKGSALLEFDEDCGVVLHGVAPAGCAGVGDDPGQVFLDFRSNFRAMMEHYAEEAGSPDEFMELARAFVSQRTAQLQTDWDEALMRLRRQQEGAPEGLGLKPVDADSFDYGIWFEILTRLAPCAEGDATQYGQAA
jgi:hypothetical protein